MTGVATPLPGIRWVLDLLPHWPKVAVDAIGAYLLAHAQFLPDGRLAGLSDAMNLITAYYIGSPGDLEARRLALFDLSSREFERLIERFYAAQAHSAVLTPASSDGGRAIIATRGTLGSRDSQRVDCKLYEDPVGIHHARALLGVVSHENTNKGVLVTSSRFTRGANALAASDDRIDLIDGQLLVRLLNEHLGFMWPTQVQRYLAESLRAHPDASPARRPRRL
jgi:restriction system protein